MQPSFAGHEVGHQQNMLLYGFPIDVSRLPEGGRVHLRQAIKSTKAAPSGTAESKAWQMRSC